MAMEDISMEDILAGAGAPEGEEAADPKAEAFSQLEMLDKQIIVDYLKEQAILPPDFEMPEMEAEMPMESEEAPMPENITGMI